MPAKKKTAKVPKESKAVATLSDKPVWAGVAGITGPSKPAEQELIMKVGQAFGIPPIGVNILGGKPYINKDGLLFKLQQYKGAIKKGQGRVKGIRKEFIAYAMKIEDTAVVKATIEFDDDTFVEGIGEASPANVSKGMDKVAASLNMLAETRAVNRAIRQVITFDLWTEAMERFASMDEESRKMIEEAATVSAEEMDQSAAKKKEDIAAPSTEATLTQQIQAAISNAKDAKTLEQIKAKVELSDKISEGAKRMIIGMIDGKLKAV